MEDNTKYESWRNVMKGRGTDSSEWGQRDASGCCGQANEHSGSIECG